MNQTAFVPGDSIEINALITNDSNREVENSVAYFIQVCC